MVQTVVAYCQSISPGVLTELNAVPDPHVRVEGKKIYAPAFAPRILAVFGVGPSLDRVRLKSPQLRTIANIEVTPLQRGLSTPGSPPAIQSFYENPVALVANDILTCEAIHSAAAAEVEIVVVFLVDAKPTPVVGVDYRSVRCTTNVTLTAYAWTNAALIFDEDLPVGRYQVIGMRARSPNLIAARLLFVGYAHRPGVLAAPGIAHIEHPMFREGRMGVFGEFDSVTPPTVDFLAAAADANPEVILDVVKIA